MSQQVKGVLACVFTRRVLACGTIYIYVKLLFLSSLRKHEVEDPDDSERNDRVGDDHRIYRERVGIRRVFLGPRVEQKQTHTHKYLLDTTKSQRSINSTMDEL